jgi:diaminopimelate epimerase
MDTPVIATYGHGTENDFVLLFDPDSTMTISGDEIKAICNRATGVGADGFIRITKLDGKWFMDYRNADGSLAEMCGNGIRVMARYLIERGHQGEGLFPITTRDGVKFMRAPHDGDISVNIGQVTDEGDLVTVEQHGQKYSGRHISVGNPHAVVFLEDLDDVGSLAVAPIVTPESVYPEGVNVEFVEIEGPDTLIMRVHERGSGETKSCGTGTCAVALAATIFTRGKLPARWIIKPPGGTLIVDIDGHSNATLTGPAVLINDVDISSFLVNQ